MLWDSSIVLVRTCMAHEFEFVIDRRLYCTYLQRWSILPKASIADSNCQTRFSGVLRCRCFTRFLSCTLYKLLLYVHYCSIRILQYVLWRYSNTVLQDGHGAAVQPLLNELVQYDIGLGQLWVRVKESRLYSYGTVLYSSKGLSQIILGEPHNIWPLQQSRSMYNVQQHTVHTDELPKNALLQHYYSTVQSEYWTQYVQNALDGRRAGKTALKIRSFIFQSTVGPKESETGPQSNLLESAIIWAPAYSIGVRTYCTTFSLWLWRESCRQFLDSRNRKVVVLKMCYNTSRCYLLLDS